MLTRQEKEKLVIELYYQGKTIRDIAKELRISFRDIGAILKRASGEVEDKQDIKESISPSTKAYRLFSEGKTPIEVAIALNLSEVETTKYYEEYLNLKQMHDLKMIYEEIGDDVVDFLKLYKLSKDAHMKPEHVVKLLQVSNGYLPLLELKYKKLTKEIDSLESEKQKLGVLGNQVSVLSQVADKYREEIKNLQKKKIRLEILLSGGKYEKVKKIAEKEITSILSKRRDLLKLAVSSVIESIIRDPGKYNFMVSCNTYNGNAASHPYIDVYRTLILDEAQKLFDLMVGGLTTRIINETALTIHPP